MPSYLCKCDARIDYTAIPAPCSYFLIEDRAADVEQDLITWRTENALNVLKCPDCGRLWIFWDGMQNAPTEYRYVGVDPRGA
jgi:hypothetical protein